MELKENAFSQAAGGIGKVVEGGTEAVGGVYSLKNVIKEGAANVINALIPGKRTDRIGNATAHFGDMTFQLLTLPFFSEYALDFYRGGGKLLQGELKEGATMMGKAVLSPVYDGRRGISDILIKNKSVTDVKLATLPD